jgi:glycine betaine catabolism B
MKVTLDHTEDIAQNIRTFWFKPEKKPHHVAGQFIELRIPHDQKDKRGDKRWFTLSSSPTEDLLSITTKLTDPNGSSFKSALANLKKGTELSMASPMGDFILPKDPEIPLVLVAGGIGCTPYRSMVKYLHDTHQKRDITLIYAARSKDEIAFKNIFSVLGPQFKTVVEERLTAEKILDLSGHKPNQYIYLSGPEPMIEALEKDLKKAGVNKRQIHTDFFPGYLEV